MHARPSGIVTLTTDFGLGDPYVGHLKGAVAMASDKPRLVDLTHDIAPGDVATGAFVLWSARKRFPTGTVHVGAVGAGVSGAAGARRVLVAAAHGQYWLAPDNGLLGAVLAADPSVEVRVLDVQHLRLQAEADAFDGRALFAPVAAWLASGRYGFSAMGPRCADANDADPVFGGDRQIVYVDRAGVLVSNVADPGESASVVRCGEHTVPMYRTPADVHERGVAGEPFAYVGGLGLVEIAVAGGGSASDRLGLTTGAAIAPGTA